MSLDLMSSLEEMAEKIRQREVSPLELVEATLVRINRLNPTLNAFISLSESARSVARAQSGQLERATRQRPLFGIPISVKDLILTRDMSTTAGSRVFGDGLPAKRDALVVRRLRRAGAIIIGKNHLHEFAYGVTNENGHYGPARNPWRPEFVSGGSSGGSAVAVATGGSFASIGTDTRGSIRIPAGCCGVTGLKPTRGRISTRGVLPLSWTLDHVGPLTRTVGDAAILFNVLDGSRRRPQSMEDVTEKRHWRIGLADYYLSDIDAGIGRVLDEAVRTLEKMGCTLHRVAPKTLKGALDASGVIASSEALSYHNPFIQSNSQGYDPAVLKRLGAGSAYSAVDLVAAMQARRRTIEEFAEIFREVDCLVGGVLPCLPPRIGGDSVRIDGRIEEVVPQLVRLNAPQNVAGVPALALPAGFVDPGLPVGLQLISAVHRESVLFNLGARFQSATDFHLRRPRVTAGATASPDGDPTE